jgi:hypothetical protein
MRCRISSAVLGGRRRHLPSSQAAVTRACAWSRAISAGSSDFGAADAGQLPRDIPQGCAAHQAMMWPRWCAATFSPPGEFVRKMAARTALATALGFLPTVRQPPRNSQSPTIRTGSRSGSFPGRSAPSTMRPLCAAQRPSYTQDDWHQLSARQPVPANTGNCGKTGYAGRTLE